jgi:hypothetical protein
LDRAVGDGPTQPHLAAGCESRRLLQPGVSLRDDPRDRRRLRDAVRRATVVHGRAGLGTLRAGGVRRHGVRSASCGRRRARSARLRLLRHRIAAAGEGLPRLGSRAHSRRHAVAGGARLGREARQAGAASSAGRR